MGKLIDAESIFTAHAMRKELDDILETETRRLTTERELLDGYYAGDFDLDELYDRLSAFYRKEAAC
jgi:hypothetical protein